MVHAHFTITKQSDTIISQDALRRPELKVRIGNETHTDTTRAPADEMEGPFDGLP